MQGDGAMLESTITAKGQTTVPAEIRHRLGVHAGSQLVWHLMPNGGLIVRAKNQSVLALAGSLQAPKGCHVATEDMKAWR
jgi:AbrB family looped-hinge helix DNA binding protein